MGRLRWKPLRNAAFRDRAVAAAGKAPLLELETEGALRVKGRVENAITIFVNAPMAELERRLRERATESSGVIEERLQTAALQLEERERFDFVVENDDRALAADRLAEIIARSSDGRYHGAAMIHPRIDELMGQVDSRYSLVIVAAKRARQINNYHHQLGEGTFDEFAPPLIESRSKNYLTMALEEVAEGKIVYEYPKK